MSASDSTDSDSRVLGVDGPDTPLADDLAGDPFAGELFEADAFCGNVFCLGLTVPLLLLAIAFEADGLTLMVGSMHSFQRCCSSSRLSCPLDVLREKVLSVVTEAEVSEILRLT